MSAPPPPVDLDTARSRKRGRSTASASRSFGRTTAVALHGISGTPVSIEASVNDGLPGIDIVGLPDTSVTESRKRIRAAISNLGITLTSRRVTVNLSPGGVKKVGTAFDLGIAVAILEAEGKIPADRARGIVHIGELGLDGRIHPVRGVLPSVLAGLRAGATRFVVPAANAEEAGLVDGAEVRGAANLADAVTMLGGEIDDPGLPAIELPEAAALPPPDVHDLAEVQGQDDARFALEVAAAGGHHLLMTGTPGAGKTLLAGCLPGLLPPLDVDEACEVVALRSLDGTLDPAAGLDRTPPFEAPHHRTSASAMVGGSRPGSIGVFSRAHRGVLFMDEARNGKHTSLAKEVTDECHRQETRKQRTARSVNAERGLPRVREDWAGGTSGGHEADLSVPAAVEVSQGQGGRDRASADRPGSEARPGGRLDDHG